MPDSFVDPELKSMHEPEDINKLRERLDNKNRNEILLIAVENHQIVGMALGREADGVCKLNFLGVVKDCRGRGVGSKLLDRFIKEGRNRKAHKIWLDTSPRLVPAIRLYVRNGFVPEGFLRKHSRGLDMISTANFSHDAKASSRARTMFLCLR